MATTSKERRAMQQQMQAIIAESRRSAAKAARAAGAAGEGEMLQPSLPGMQAAAIAQAAQPVGHAIPERVAELVYSIPANRRLDELVLTPQNVQQIEEFIDEFVNASLLRSNSLEPRHRVLLVGPPGNGKTSLAEVLATELALPLLSLRYDAIVDSFLGETSNRLRRLIEYATLNPCVLFFDEFEAVGKERSDAQETGEIKRVVSSLLMQIDRLPSHTIIVCATNHPELLDRAVWRRFQLKLFLDKPDADQLRTWFERFTRTLGAPVGVSADVFARAMAGQSMSDVAEFTMDVRRKMVLSRGALSAEDAITMVMKRGKLQAIAMATRERGDGNRPSDSSSGKSGDSRSRKGSKTEVPPSDPI